MFQLDLKSRKSIYEQVVDNLKELIISDVLRAEDKLPSVRELSRTLTVNPNTVQKAYRELERQGYVYTASGRGTFVAGRTGTSPDPEKIEKIIKRIENEIAELFYLGADLSEIQNRIDKLLQERGNRS